MVMLRPNPSGCIVRIQRVNLSSSSVHAPWHRGKASMVTKRFDENNNIQLFNRDCQRKKENKVRGINSALLP